MRPWRMLIALNLLELVVHTTTAAATTLVVMRTEAIARSADVAVVGQVIATEARWAGRRIVTRVRLRPDGAGPDVWFEHAGGTVDGLTMRVLGMPEFRRGERTLVLLAARGDRLRLVGLGEGKLAVIERGGRQLVWMRVRDGGPLESVPLADAQAALRRATVRR